ncbi:hypothetical protein TEA_002901 [Camellia sinensis var. sinensis]|uniref:Uncharacterized protein n=1 Tax=Camellia sinensis var. sinensis TaxID=542762 RepID=A0A4S4DD28_CAMSN|nr:hypothetical protein TEA_002901 [Camellia sinensis var. sinensis]
MPLLSDSWNLSHQDNTVAPHGFVVNRISGLAYVAFFDAQIVVDNLVALDCDVIDGLFSTLRCRSGETEEEPIMVHTGMFRFFFESVEEEEEEEEEDEGMSNSQEKKTKIDGFARVANELSRAKL